MFVAHRNVGVGSLASFLAQRSVVRFGSKKPTCNQACYHYEQQSLRHELTSIRRRPDASLHPLIALDGWSTRRVRTNTPVLVESDEKV